MSTESYWLLTEAGIQAAVVETSKKAPRQTELLHWLQLHPQGVTKRQLQEHESPKHCFKDLN